MEPQGQNRSPETASNDSKERLPKPIIPEADSSLEAESLDKSTERTSDGAAKQNAGMPSATPVAQPSVQSGNDESDDVTKQHIDIGETPPVAGDDDLIEKEWVKKAKEVVERTAGDPKLQSDAIGEVKVDYRKKRFGVELDKQDKTEG